jgi:hypothetical protein
MAHSRNVAFKVATGDIVNNVDADHFTLPGFAAHVNLMANQCRDDLLVFVKSRQRNRGRLGMFREQFLRLGGYDECIQDYGSEDLDLIMRSYHSGFSIAKFGGNFCKVTEDHARHPTENYINKDWKFTQRRNFLVSLLGIMMFRFEANKDREWGKAHLVKNFSVELDV